MYVRRRAGFPSWGLDWLDPRRRKKCTLLSVPQKRIEWGGTFENTCKNMVEFMYPLTLYPKWGISEAKSEGVHFTAYIDLNLSVFSPEYRVFSRNFTHKFGNIAWFQRKMELIEEIGRTKTLNTSFWGTKWGTFEIHRFTYI